MTIYQDVFTGQPDVCGDFRRFSTPRPVLPPTAESTGALASVLEGAGDPCESETGELGQLAMDSPLRSAHLSAGKPPLPRCLPEDEPNWTESLRASGAAVFLPSSRIRSILYRTIHAVSCTTRVSTCTGRVRRGRESPTLLQQLECHENQTTISLGNGELSKAL